ncbi:adenosylcobinamide-phosphate synthase CbiB [Desulfomicrobium escambiense]|uniref:adenosylcobinamide-phosphate synthase CbiB n=1 Tax=Desulfomicrobium escambiense TaxID=29503 RepID=UPI000404ABBE|nr:adenosylcobinamide-phosphate synthase CbiB [Desulfomicrobium escambiense]
MLDALYDLPLNLSLFVFLLGCMALDLLFGDPADWPHPVRLIGRILNRLEGWAGRSWLGPRLAGAVAVAGLAGGCALLVRLLMGLPFVGEMLALYLGYAGLALGCLLREVQAVLNLLESGRLAAARVHLAGLVSRDTADMTEEEVLRALGETLAENFNDGFVAPFFWLSLLGPAALWGYKAVSTADSMWGYRTERFEELGKAGARADDVLAWVPARLAAFLIWVAGWVLGNRASWKAIATDARTMDSPNAGWPMSAAAHAAGVSMGGPTRYFGEIKDKPPLGPLGVIWSATGIRRMRRVIVAAALLAAAGLTLLGSALAWWSL